MDFLQEYSHSTPLSVWEKVRNQFQHEKENAEQSKKNDVAKYVILRWTFYKNIPTVHLTRCGKRSEISFNIKKYSCIEDKGVLSTRY
jgi:hypothetical protein